MDVVSFTAFREVNLESLFRSRLRQDFLEESFDFRRQHLSSVLHRPYHMVVDVIDADPCMNKIFLHVRSISNNRMYCKRKQQSVYYGRTMCRLYLDRGLDDALLKYPLHSFSDSDDYPVTESLSSLVS